MSRHTTNKRTTDEETLQDKFIIAMDNYFTLPRAIKSLRERKIGVVGTARFKQGWPPKQLRNLDGKNFLFNHFYWMVDSMRTLVARWMDNGLVFLVSTVHTVGKTVEKCRQKQRETGKNKAHINLVWGRTHKLISTFPPLSTTTTTG